VAGQCSSLYLEVLLREAFLLVIVGVWPLAVFTKVVGRLVTMSCIHFLMGLTSRGPGQPNNHNYLHRGAIQGPGEKKRNQLRCV